VPIGRWVLREACSQGQAWHDAGPRPIRVFVHISAVELRDKEFVAGVRFILMETRFDPTCVELELTETHHLEDSKSTTAGSARRQRSARTPVAHRDHYVGERSCIGRP
jgi:EAL domain-containing protein (putative c-di-GMP-specific phosphodiesterase class I)